MPTVFIAGLAIPLSSRFAPGQAMSENAASVLNVIQRQRIVARLRYLVAKGDISPAELQAKAEELSRLDLQPYSTSDDDDSENDPVYVEALAMARELIVGRMAQEGLPPPKGIDTHAKALVDAMPQLQEKARLRIEARYRAANSAIEEAV